LFHICSTYRRKAYHIAFVSKCAQLPPNLDDSQVCATHASKVFIVLATQAVWAVVSRACMGLSRTRGYRPDAALFLFPGKGVTKEKGCNGSNILHFWLYPIRFNPNYARNECRIYCVECIQETLLPPLRISDVFSKRGTAPSRISGLMDENKGCISLTYLRACQR